MNLIQFTSNLVKQDGVILDIGCGNKCYESKIKQGKFVSIDALAELNPNYVIDLEYENLPFDSNSFDMILLLDFIEHLTKHRGSEIIKQCQQIARKYILISTPIFWTDNSVNINNHIAWKHNPYNEHKSLWEISDFSEGWKRIEGLKNLQKQYVLLWEK